MLPNIVAATPLSPLGVARRLLVIAEGFEKRSLSWIQYQPPSQLFSQSIICKYEPEQVGQLEEVLAEVSIRSTLKPIVIDYNRFNPSPFEQKFSSILDYNNFDEIVIDISVMSKLLIMIVFHSLQQFRGNIRVVYTEPKTWSPSVEEYAAYIKKHEESMTYAGLSSIGVFDVVKTPGLSSIVMQGSQSKLITFTSSNEHLLAATLNEIVPSKTVLINAKNEREPWRAEAALKIHQKVIENYGINDKVECINLLDYRAVFAFLADEYRKDCYTHRMVIAPTGGKIHTIACALIKNCCSDIHIEYPTPEGYILESYSSKEIEGIHEIIFPRFKDLIVELRSKYNLDG